MNILSYPLSKGFLSCVVLALTMLLLTSCAKKPPMHDKSPHYQRGVVDDLYAFPQDLTVYAKNVRSNLLSATAQKAQDERFNRIYFSPWQKTKAGFSKRAFSNLIGGARGYMGNQAWSKSLWANIKESTGVSSYPNMQKRAITLRNTDVRELPTSLPRYSKPNPNPLMSPFDYFQYSTLPPGMPIFVSQKSTDGQWYFVENSLAAGWVRSIDVALVSSEFISKYTNGNYAAIIQDKVKLQSMEGQALGSASIGAIFPIVKESGDALTVLVPAPNTSGYATLTQVTLEQATAVKKPMPLEAMNVAKVGNVMMGQPYGWGGSNDYRDCSSTLHDLFTPFGIWLPRNSKSQYAVGNKISVENLASKAKEKTIIQKATPFMSLIWMPGHITLYLGEYEGKAAMFHNIWGIRVDEQGQGTDRHIIGRAVVTSLKPGDELANFIDGQTLLKRIGGFNTLP